MVIKAPKYTHCDNGESIYLVANCRLCVSAYFLNFPNVVITADPWTGHITILTLHCPAVHVCIASCRRIAFASDDKHNQSTPNGLKMCKAAILSMRSLG